MDNPRPPESPPVQAGSEPLIGAALGTGLFAAIGALALFSWLGREVLAGATQAMDLEVRMAVRALAAPALTRVMWGASVYGAPRWLAVVGVGAAVLFFVRGWPRGSALVVVTLTGAMLLDAALKQLYGRIRPESFFENYPVPDSFSFPSGHALFATCFFGGLAVLLSHRLPRPGQQVAVWLGALLAIGLIGVSRIYLGVHYPSDVLGGYAAGTVWVAAVALGDRLAEHRRLRGRYNS